MKQEAISIIFDLEIVVHGRSKKRKTYIKISLKHSSNSNGILEKNPSPTHIKDRNCTNIQVSKLYY